MPVTFTVASHPANPVGAPYHPLQSAEGLLDSTWGQRNRYKVRSKRVLQSTFSDSPVDLTKIRPKKNGFMNTVVEAYNRHHHLVLRPDDVWIAILGQFNFYVNAHAEELRSSFVAHEGQKELYVEGADFGHLARRMTELIDENVVDKELREWILPNFTTTRHNDVVVASVLMMATLKAYFSYGMGICCGLPSVTLEGERSDWVNILNRVEKLEMFGDEPTAWAKLLRPILSRFVSSFDGSPDLDFWSKICHYHSGGSGPDQMCGWITAFAVWNTEGKWQGPNPKYHREGVDKRSGMYSLTLDDAQYGIMNPDKIPSGYCEVDVKFNDDGTEYDCMMVAGHMGQLTEGEDNNTVRPLPAWFMFIKEEVPASEKPKWY